MLSVLQLPKSDITAYLTTQTVPELSNELYYCPRATKLQWKKGKYKLGENGIYTITVSDNDLIMVEYRGTPLIKIGDLDKWDTRATCLFHFRNPEPSSCVLV